ncbi:glycosyltransferase family 2 protein [Candidatus Pacearchaeota archaeon]|nr:glycosyltransferase family 2 protein [Candidatus Pacearchaeota archaeon]
MTNNPEISIVLPCRNEEKALPNCLKKIKKVIIENNLNAEIIVSDSSTDNSPKIAKNHNVRLIKHDKIGYGIAYQEGFKEAYGKYIFMADADCTYDFNEIPNFIKYLKEGHDFVIGNRFAYKFEKNIMPWSHKYIGNPILSSILRLFFGTKIKDSHCGMRAISKKALESLDLKTKGMEFASEMVIKAHKKHLKIKELPIKYYPREGESKLSSFKDGWRHLKYMLLYSPLFLFFIPGLILFIIGIESMLWFYLGNPKILGIQLFFHPMFISSLFIIIGYQLIIFTAFSKIYALTHLGEENKLLDKLFKYFTIERVSLIGILILLIGIIIYTYILIKWISSGFGSLNEIKNSILALTLITIGVQSIFSSFMLSIIGTKEK